MKVFINIHVFIDLIGLFASGKAIKKKDWTMTNDFVKLIQNSLHNFWSGLPLSLCTWEKRS